MLNFFDVGGKRFSFSRFSRESTATAVLLFTFFCSLLRLFCGGVAGYCPETSAAASAEAATTAVVDVGNGAVCRVWHFLLLRNGFGKKIRWAPCCCWRLGLPFIIMVHAMLMLLQIVQVFIDQLGKVLITFPHYGYIHSYFIRILTTSEWPYLLA